MGAAEVPYNRKTYQPGDPWTHGDFATLAATAPRITEQVTAPGTTSPSYFENRRFRGSVQTVSVGCSSGTVVLECSFDGGDTWQTVETYSAATQKQIDYPDYIMLRLRVSAGTNVTCRLFQGL